MTAAPPEEEPKQTGGRRSRVETFRLACAPEVVIARLDELEREEEGT